MERLGEMESFLQKLKRLDAYPKVNEDFYKRTLSGGVVTLVAAVVMLLHAGEPPPAVPTCTEHTTR